MWGFLPCSGLSKIMHKKTLIGANLSGLIQTMNLRGIVTLNLNRCNPKLTPREIMFKGKISLSKEVLNG